jgi:hypothetical protein
VFSSLFRGKTTYQMGLDVGALRAEDARQDRRIDDLEAKVAAFDPDVAFARDQRLRREKRTTFAHRLANDAWTRAAALGVGLAVPLVVGWCAHILTLHFHLF